MHMHIHLSCAFSCACKCACFCMLSLVLSFFFGHAPKGSNWCKGWKQQLNTRTERPQEQNTVTTTITAITSS